MNKKNIGTPSHIRILVVEDEPELLELLSYFVQSEFNSEVVEAKNGLEAKKILEVDPHFDFVISDYNMPEMNGGELLDYIRSSHLPIKFILVSALDQSKIFQQKKITPDAVVTKPFFTEPLLSALRQLTEHLEIDSKPDQYTSASIDHLFRFGTVPYPLFAQLSDKKFIKVLKENDYFGIEELERFRKKNITHLYLESIHSQIFFKKQLDAFLALSQNKDLSHEELTIVNNDISLIIKEMVTIFGFSKELECSTKNAVDLAFHTITTDPAINGSIKNAKLGSGNPLILHSSRLPYLANYIVQIMGWESDTTPYKMALASILHDITLNHQIHAKFEFDFDSTKVAQKELNKEHFDQFINHPLKAANLASRFAEIPTDVEMIIAQHHENCEGTGFPYRLNHARIAPLSSAFIVAHDILCYYDRVGDQFKMENFIEHKNDHYQSGHFKRILIELILTSAK